MSSRLARCVRPSLAAAPAAPPRAHGLASLARGLAMLAAWLGAGIAQQPATDALAALVARPAVDGGLRVRVRGPEDRATTPAIVVWIDLGAPDYSEWRTAAERAHPGDEPAFYRALAAHGARHALDEFGSTRVPNRNGLLVATLGDACAVQFVSQRDLPGVTLEARPSRRATVEVRAADGAPGSAVRLAVVNDAGNEMFFADTDATGRGTVRIVDRHGKAPRVRVGAATRQPVEAALPVDGGACTLTLPPCVPLQANLRGELTPGSDVVWRLRCGDPVRTVRPTASDLQTARFAFVEVGLVGKVQAIVDGRTEQTDLPEVRAGDPVTVTVVRASDGRIVVVRVVDHDGKPFVGHHVDVQCAYEGGSYAGNGKTNSAGWLELPITNGDGKKVTLDLIVGLRSWDGPRIASGRRELGDLAAGRHVLGDLACTPLPIAARGVLLDRDGKPAADVPLSVHAGSWQRIQSAADGSFEIRVPPSADGTLQLQPGEGWFFVDPPFDRQPLAKGEVVARLTVQRAARVRFQAKGIARSPLNQFEFMLLGADDEHVAYSLHPDLAGHELRIPAGHWHFIVRHRHEEVLRLDNLRADPGVETHDPRFMDFDWRAFATVVKVRLEGPDGKPTSNATVWLRSGGGGSGTSPTNGELALLVRKDGGHVTIDPGDKRFASIDLGVVTTDQVVRLGSGPRVRIELEGLPKLPAGARLMLRGDEHGTNEGIAFDEHGTAELWLPAVGPFVPRLAVHSGSTSHLLGLTLEAVDVPAGGASKRLSGTDVQAAIDALQLGR